MALKEQSQNNKTNPQRQEPKPVTNDLNISTSQQTLLDTAAQRARLDPRALTQRDVVQLQRTIGNQAVGRLLTQTAPHRPIQKKDNHTSTESLSSKSIIDHVNVHYNSSQSASIIQREESWVRWENDDMDTFVTNLDKLVNRTAKAIIANPLGVPEADGYLKRWLGLVASFAKTWQESGGLLESAFAAEPFVYTAFGYAVESLTNLQIKSELGGDLPQEHTIALQATRGHTRPDIVVKNGMGQDVGWFDITASRSETHIDQKTGSGWGTRAYVAEVTYPSLTAEDLLAICKNTLSKELSSDALEHLSKLAASNKALRDKQYAKAAGLVRLSIKSVDDLSNMSKRRARFEETLGTLITGEETKLPPQTAKGLIAEVWPLISTSYAKLAAEAGYKQAKAAGARAEPARELIYSLAVDETL